MSLVTEWERKTIRTTDDEEEEAIDGESYLCQGLAEHGNERIIENQTWECLFTRNIQKELQFYLKFPKLRLLLKYF